MAFMAGAALLEAIARKEREEKEEKKLHAETVGVSDSMMKKCKEAMDTIQAALRLYEPKEMAISFNGGKDATVLLHLVMAGIASMNERWESMEELACVYFEDEECFEEVEEFIRQCQEQFHLRIIRLKTGYKDG